MKELRGAADKPARILLVAFGGLLALMAVAGFAGLLSLRQLHEIERQVNQRYATHSQALTAILISVHIYHDQMERYLLDQQGAEDRGDAEDVMNRGTEVQNALQHYPADADPQERVLVADIEQKILEQENSFAALISERTTERPQERQQFYREQMMLRRAYILQVSRKVSSWNERKLEESARLLAVKFHSVKKRLELLVGLSLLAGVFWSLLGGYRILRLEQQGGNR